MRMLITVWSFGLNRRTAVSYMPLFFAPGQATLSETRVDHDELNYRLR